jgi:two-component system OmpR family response regulator
MLPSLDGLAIVKTIRDAGVKAPVLFLTARGGIDDRVEGLEAGGDDYLTKPFAFSELMARLNALARRPPLTPIPTELRVADLHMDLIAREVKRGGEAVEVAGLAIEVLEATERRVARLAIKPLTSRGGSHISV